MGNIFLLRFTGEDRVGLTSELTATLAELGTEVLDINQAVIHQSLLLGMMVRVSKGTLLPEPIQDVANRLDLRVKIQSINDTDYDQWVGRQGKPRYILTLLARSIEAAHLAAVTRVITEEGLNIDVIHRLSGRPQRIEAPETPRRACVEFWLRGEPYDKPRMQARYMELSRELAIDIAWQKDDAYRRSRRLVAFDMDSTLIQAEVIDELAKEAGCGEEVAAITEMAMRGELDFDTSLRRRVATLKGLPESAMQRVAQRLQLTEGAETLLLNLRELGYRTAILSGGFSYFGNMLRDRLGFNYVHANELEIVDGKLTGQVLAPIVNGQRKADLLEQIATSEGINRRQIIAIGDGANDLPMLNRAGLGIAFHAKPIVRQEAGHAVSNLGLDAVLYLLGVRDRERVAEESKP
ncbi:phosphoserine phosphatase SerB [Aureliella helgolandensis]|uniref:Phosphoserine phosphatase n=1 Tax=Aureliella helgolandensis TaxID=2527968 RepID=A0A518G2B4_9BACT|nr:phosphoserine phosphatase SerB [Aureliella helgolandensis]QDV22738.1 Phosphoserine phosphatase [Aureliella helgolandensis]